MRKPTVQVRPCHWFFTEVERATYVVEQFLPFGLIAWPMVLDCREPRLIERFLGHDAARARVGSEHGFGVVVVCGVFGPKVVGW